MTQYSNQPGVLLDERAPEQKEKDYKFEELVTTAAPVNWTIKTPEQWRSFPIFDQGRSGSCVAQTLKKMLSVYIWVKTRVWVALSATHIYQRRQNKPSAGMAGINAFDIARQGTTLEDFAPSEKLTDAQMDAMQVKPFMDEVGKVFRIGNYLTVAPGNIDTVASIIQETGKAVMVWFYFSDGLRPVEWTDIPKVEHDITVIGQNTARHSVAAVDFTLVSKTNAPDNPELWGKKALIIEDSWGLSRAKYGRRIITEDFFRTRNYFVGHFINFAFEGQSQPITPRPRYNWLRNLAFSPTVSYDNDVKALQDVLKHEGFFPTNVESTGYYGAITRTAVGNLQQKHGIARPGEPGHGVCGPRTREYLNRTYN